MVVLIVYCEELITEHEVVKLGVYTLAAPPLFAKFMEVRNKIIVLLLKGAEKVVNLLPVDSAV